MKLGNMELENVQDSTGAIVRPRLVKRQEPIEARPDDGPRDTDKERPRDMLEKFRQERGHANPRQEFRNLFTKY